MSAPRYRIRILGGEWPPIARRVPVIRPSRPLDHPGRAAITRAMSSRISHALRIPAVPSYERLRAAVKRNEGASPASSPPPAGRTRVPPVAPVCKLRAAPAPSPPTRDRPQASIQKGFATFSGRAGLHGTPIVTGTCVRHPDPTPVGPERRREEARSDPADRAGPGGAPRGRRREKNDRRTEGSAPRWPRSARRAPCSSLSCRPPDAAPTPLNPTRVAGARP